MMMKWFLLAVHLKRILHSYRKIRESSDIKHSLKALEEGIRVHTEDLPLDTIIHCYCVTFFCHIIKVNMKHHLQHILLPSCVHGYYS